MRRSPIRLALVLAIFTLVAFLAGCSTAVDQPDSATDARRDVPVDATAPMDVVDEPQCRSNIDCDNGVFCDGEERCVGGRCVEAAGPACDDRRSCTTDICDEAMRMCTHTPDDSMCGDMNACNGIERCDPSAPGANAMTGCTPVRAGNVIDCDDGNNCTIDTCDPSAGCVHAPRDLDGDGHVDRACTIDGTPGGTPGDDCNDGDPAVFPGAPEICDDSRDNNCDGSIDYFDTTCRATNDACASATVLPGPGIYYGTTVDLTNDYALGCNSGTFADAVFEFTTRDVQDVTISISTARPNAAVALVDNCMPYTELRCARGSFGSAPILRFRSLPAGTHRIVVETGTPAEAFRLSLRYDAPTTTPTEDLCPTMGMDPAVELNDGMPHTAMLGMLEDDYVLSCNSFSSGSRDAVFRLTLAADSDVVLTATPVGGGSGTTYMSFRNSPCAVSTSERRCINAFGTAGARLVQRALPAGTYWVIVENSMNNTLAVQASITTPPTPTVTYAMSTPTGVTFTDACAIAGHSEVLSGVDDATAPIPATAVGFPIRFYGIPVTPPFTVSSNGYMVMGSGTSFPLSGSVPDPAMPNMVLAGYWRDLITRTPGVCFVTTGTAPNRRFIVQWQDARHFGGSGSEHLTFEIVFNEAPAGQNNVIDIIYQTMTGAATSGPGAGIENDDGTVGTTITGPFTAPRVIRLTPSPM